MEPTKNLCAQIPFALHTKVREEQGKSGMTLSEYVTDVLTQFYNREGVKSTMENNTKTLAFQIPEELFQRLKDHLAREKERTGKKLSQRDFILGLITQALDEAERQDQDPQPV